MALSTFRRSTKSEKKGMGKGPRGNWRENFRLPKGTPAAFALIAGDYVDPDPSPEQVEVDLQTGQPLPVKLKYYKWLKHRLKTVNQKTGKQLFIDEPCSRGWDKHNPQMCIGCYAMEAGDKRITLNAAFSIGLVHLAVYHRHPIWDREKNTWVMKKDKQEPIFIESECYGKSCNFCKYLSGQPPVLMKSDDFWPQYPQGSITQVFGSRRYLELGSGHLGDLGEWDRQIGSKCGGVAYVRDAQGQYVKDAAGNAIPKGRCNNFLSVDGYACPICNNVLINAESDPRTLEELDALAIKKYPCHHCQRPVFMKEINSCEACGNAVVNNIFDGILWGQRQGEDTQSHMVLVQFDTVEEYQANMSPELRQLLGEGKSLHDRINELSKPYEFAELYKPKDVAGMAKRLEIQVPPGFGGQQVAPGFGGVPYGQPTAAPPGWVPNQGPSVPQAPPPAYPGVVPQQPAAMPQYQPQPGYAPYPPTGAPSTPGPTPFVAPPKPNFGN